MGQLEKCRKDKFAGGMNLSDGQRDDPGELILCEQINVIIDESNAQDGRITVLENATVDHGDLTGLAGVVDHMEAGDFPSWNPNVPSIILDGTTDEAKAAYGVALSVKSDPADEIIMIIITPDIDDAVNPSAGIELWTGDNASGKSGNIEINTGSGATPADQGIVALNGRFMLIPRQGADPAGGQNGGIYYNVVTNKFRGYENGAWANLI